MPRQVHYLEDFNSPLITPVQKPIRESIKSAAFHLASLGESPAELAMLPKFAHVYEMQISFMAKAESPSLAEECTMMEGRMSTKAELVSYCCESPGYFNAQCRRVSSLTLRYAPSLWIRQLKFPQNTLFSGSFLSGDPNIRFRSSSSFPWSSS